MINWAVAFYASGVVFFVASVLVILGADLTIFN